MKWSAKIAIFAGTVMAVTLAQNALVISHSQNTLSHIVNIRQRSLVFSTALHGMQTAFYGYDDQMNMYVLVEKSGNQTTLAARTYDQATEFQKRFTEDLKTAQAIHTSNPQAALLLSRLNHAFNGYQKDANQVKNDITLHHLSQAIKLQTVGNTSVSADIMTTLSQLMTIGQSDMNDALTGVRNNQSSTVRLIWIVSGVELILLTLLVVGMQYLAIRPLGSLKKVAEHLAQGNIEDVISYRSSDELGDLANAFRNMMSYLSEWGHIAESIGSGDLTVAPVAKGSSDKLGHAIVTMHGRLTEIISGMQDMGHLIHGHVTELTGLISQTTDATHQISEAISESAQATGESSQGLQQIAASMQQLKAAVEQVATGAVMQADQAQGGEKALNEMKSARLSVHDTAKRMEQLSLQSRQAAQSGRQQVEETLSAMSRIADVTRVSAEAITELGKHSEKIGAIVGTIQEIAAQTNLLALNANIEAARAGEHGRGFAVVADEVRKLAEQSAREAKNVSELIRTIQSTVKQSVSSMETGQKEVVTGQALGEQTRTALEDMEKSVAQVAGEIGQMSQAISSLDAESDGVDQGIRQISKIAQDNSAAAHQMAASSREVTDTIEGLAAISEETAASTEEVATTSQHVAEAVGVVANKTEELSQVASRLDQLVSRYRL